MSEKSANLRAVVNWIDERTLIPVSFVVILAAAIFWISTVANSARNSQEQINELKRQLDEHSKEMNIKLDYVDGVLIEMNRSLGRIEGKLN